MATGNDDNDVDGGGATGNEVNDDGDGATGNDNNDDTIAMTMTMVTATTMATAMTTTMTTMATTMVADDDDKEVDGNGTPRSFQGGTIKSSLSRTMAKATTIATATTTTMAADDDDKEVDGDGTWRSFRGGTIKASSSRESRGPQRRRGRRCVAVFRIVGIDDSGAAFLSGGGQ